MIQDFSKYKRVFAFGCSFTSWIYATYADLIFRSCPKAELYNFGKSGGGNIFIANRLTEANRKFKFNENDLVVLMWSTFARLDFWKRDTRWVTPGNIFTQNFVSKEAVEQLIDLDGVLLRDLSIIDVSTTYLNNLPCDVLKFMSVPPNYDHNVNSEDFFITQSIIDTYSVLNESYGTTYWDYLGGHWPKHNECYEYIDNFRGTMIDYHPRIIDSLNFLQHHNVPLTQASIDFANMAHEYMNKKDRKHHDDVVKFFTEEDRRRDAAYVHLW